MPWNAAFQQHLAQVMPRDFLGTRVRLLQITSQAPSPPSRVLPQSFFPYAVRTDAGLLNLPRGKGQSPVAK